MTLIQMVDTVLNPVLGWLLVIPPIIAILFLSVVLGLINTLLQKYMTDQAKMKRLKDDTKKLQAKIKSLQKEKKMDEAMSVQQKLMPIQMSLMKESFKPLVVTMVPFLVVFFWLANHFAFLPILPGEPFTVTAGFAQGSGGTATLSSDGLTIEEPAQPIENGKATWTVSGPEGRHPLTITYAGATFTRDVLITRERAYEQPQKSMRGAVTSFTVNNKKLLPLGSFSLFGWQPGWIFYYILASIPVSLLFKKLFKVV